MYGTPKHTFLDKLLQFIQKRPFTITASLSVLVFLSDKPYYYSQLKMFIIFFQQNDQLISSQIILFGHQSFL